MDRHTEDHIRQRAYALWEQDGAPEGRNQDYWNRAERELAEEAGLDTSKDAVKIKTPPLPAGSPAI